VSVIYASLRTWNAF